ERQRNPPGSAQRTTLPDISLPSRYRVLPLVARWPGEHERASRLEQQSLVAFSGARELHDGGRAEADADDHLGEHGRVHMSTNTLARRVLADDQLIGKA